LDTSPAQAFLKSELESLREEQKALVEKTAADTYKSLLSESASPLSQLILQSQLVQSPNSSLSAEDILVHVKRLITILEKNGLEVIGAPGEILPYDPKLHEPASPDFSPQIGNPVQIRFPGIGHHSTVLRKAAVDAVLRKS
jgi:molecular chaperone GrpE (heat shock protein)